MWMICAHALLFPGDFAQIVQTKKSQLHASFPPYGIHLHPNVERRSRHFNSEVREANKQRAKTQL